MKFMIGPPTLIRGTPEERRARRPLGRNVTAYQEMLAELEALAIAADDFGFHGFGVTEHHLHTEGGEAMPNSLILYANLAAKTKNILFAPLSLVLPARDPIRVAEDLALLDNLYPGRFAVSFARGYQSRWMQTLAQKARIGATPMDPESDQTNREIFIEHLDVILKAWTEDAFSFNGKHFQAPFPYEGIQHWPAAPWTAEFGSDGEVDAEGTIRKIGVVPKPASPKIEIILPYTMSRDTLVLAAERGFTMLAFIGWPDQFRAACEDYQAESRKAGRDRPLGHGVAALRKICLGATEDEAFSLGVKTAGYWFNRYFSYFGLNEGLRTPADDRTRMLTFDSDADCTRRMVEAQQMLCGTPDQVCRKIEALQKCHADGDLEWLVWEFWATGNVSSDDQMRQLEMFATKVMPHFV